MQVTHKAEKQAERTSVKHSVPLQQLSTCAVGWNKTAILHEPKDLKSLSDFMFSPLL